VGKDDKSCFCFVCRTIQVSTKSQRLGFETLWGFKFSSHLDLFGQHLWCPLSLKSFCRIGKMFWLLLFWLMVVSSMDKAAICFDTMTVDINNQHIVDITKLQHNKIFIHFGATKWKIIPILINLHFEVHPSFITVCLCKHAFSVLVDVLKCNMEHVSLWKWHEDCPAWSKVWISQIVTKKTETLTKQGKWSLNCC